MRTCLFILLAALAAAQDKPVVVEGTVVDAKTKVPLENVAVAVRYTKPPDGGRIMTAQIAQGAVTLTGPDGRFLVNELNTIPGFTNISMYPKAMGASGVGYAELIDRLIAHGLARAGRSG